MFGIGGFELLIILIFGFILVGDRLPDVAKTLGRALRTFQNAQRDMSKVIKEDVFDPDAEDPFKDPLAALDKMGGIAKKTGSSLAGDLNEMAAVAKRKKSAAPKAEVSNEEVAAQPQDQVEAAVEETPAPAESFADRRARYERERAAKLAAQAEEKAAAEAAAAAAAVQAADEIVSAAETVAEAPEAGKEEQ